MVSIFSGYIQMICVILLTSCIVIFFGQYIDHANTNVRF